MHTRVNTHTSQKSPSIFFTSMWRGKHTQTTHEVVSYCSSTLVPTRGWMRACICAGRQWETKINMWLSIKLMDMAFQGVTIAWQVTPHNQPYHPTKAHTHMYSSTLTNTPVMWNACYPVGVQKHNTKVSNYETLEGPKPFLHETKKKVCLCVSVHQLGKVEKDIGRLLSSLL